MCRTDDGEVVMGDTVTLTETLRAAPIGSDEEDGEGIDLVLAERYDGLGGTAGAGRMGCKGDDVPARLGGGARLRVLGRWGTLGLVWTGLLLANGSGSVVFAFVRCGCWLVVISRLVVVVEESLLLYSLSNLELFDRLCYQIDNEIY